MFHASNAFELSRRQNGRIYFALSAVTRPAKIMLRGHEKAEKLGKGKK
jgi:hypothetical protein